MEPSSRVVYPDALIELKMDSSSDAVSAISKGSKVDKRQRTTTTARLIKQTMQSAGREIEVEDRKEERCSSARYCRWLLWPTYRRMDGSLLSSTLHHLSLISRLLDNKIF